MKRRQFLAAVGGVAASPIVWPLAARAQQAMPVIGFLRSTTFANATQIVALFRQGLKETGFVEGQNVTVEYHSADDQPDRLRALAADLVRRPVTMIVANGIAALAAKAATTTVPIVFITGSDPVRDGLVASLNRPGGNVTGVSFLAGALGTKRLELLRQLVPKAATIAMLVNPNTAETEAERADVQPRRRGSVSKSSFSMSAATATSTRPLQQPCSAEPARCSSAPAPFSTPGGIGSSRWRPKMRCRRSTASASPLRPAG